MKRILLYLFDKIVVRLVIRVQNKLQLEKLQQKELRQSKGHHPIAAAIHKKNLFELLWDRAVQESADFVEKHISDVLVFWNKQLLWEYTTIKIQKQNIDGVCLEFGVFKGVSINYFAKHLRELKFFGFDSFEGLAEDWKSGSCWEGTFDLEGNLPDVPGNATLMKGWFDQTLPDFCQKHLEKKSVRFVHMDSDTYESSAMVLEQIAKYFRPGVLILFDEFIGYPNWQNGEFRAWQEASKKHGIKFRYLGFSNNQALVEIIG